MNKFIKFGVSILTGVVLFFALSSDNDEEISSPSSSNFIDTDGNGNCNRMMNCNDDIVVNNSSRSNTTGSNKENSSAKTDLKKAQNAFSAIANAINTVLTIMGNFSKLTNMNPGTRPSSNYVIYT